MHWLPLISDMYLILWIELVLSIEINAERYMIGDLI